MKDKLLLYTNKRVLPGLALPPAVAHSATNQASSSLVDRPSSPIQNPKTKIQNTTFRIPHSAFQWLTLATAGAVWGLIVLGGLVRVTDSGTGCGASWPMCHGHLLPSLEVHE